MQRNDASLEEIVALIEQEVGLGVRLLKYMNSAYFGFSGSVRSIKQAATMLGTRGLSRWALIVAALSGSNPIPRELALLALTRARACELVGLDYDESLDSDELFTIGLLSSCDAVFRMPMQRVVDELPLAEHIEQALLRHAGPSGEILQVGDFVRAGRVPGTEPALDTAGQLGGVPRGAGLGPACRLRHVLIAPRPTDRRRSGGLCEALHEQDCVMQCLLLVQRELLDLLAEPAVARSTVRFERGATIVGQRDTCAPPVVGVGGAIDQIVNLELGERLAHRLRAHALSGRELADALRALAVEARRAPRPG